MSEPAVTAAEIRMFYDESKYGEGNLLVKYFSMRKNGDEPQKSFYESLSPEEKQRIDKEKEELENLRDSFSASKKGLMEEHRAHLESWRNELKEKKSKYMRDLNQRIREWENNNPSRVPAGDRRVRSGLGQEMQSEEEKRQKLPFRIESGVLNLNAVINDTTLRATAGPSATTTLPTTQPTTGQTTIQPVCNPPETDASEYLNYGLKAYVMYFLNGGGVDDPRKTQVPEVKGNFPDQKIDLEALLGDRGEEILSLGKDQESKFLRWFHIPANNMAWVEKFLEKYYSKAPGETKRLLSRKYWQGQMHAYPIHARHMRPRCLSVQQVESQSKRNFVLYMPYLHWEIISRRVQIAKVIAETSNGRKGAELHNGLMGRHEREPERGRFRALVAEKILKEKYKTFPPRRSEFLGPYLMSAAKIAEEMECFADEMLLRNYLHESLPVHPRRTLDQSSFPRMEDITDRDLDQAVYRETKGGNLRLPRVVMVDQLWLWILDEHTILTSFPHRSGRNKSDSSGVHKSLRERIKDSSHDKIESVFDLALIIIDQCSRVFFDRTKPTDWRPEVMDIFSNAITRITGMKTIAFNKFWQQVTVYSFTQSISDTLSSQKTYYRVCLNIGLEGKLLREAHGIVEELRMMSKVFNDQLQVVKAFEKALDGLRNPAPPLACEPSRNGRGMSPKTTSYASEVIEKIGERLSETESLDGDARLLCQQLQDLIALKQQQASIIQAEMALKRNIKQGHSIMLFTVVSIFFLPLSFFSSIFGMNNAELGTGSMAAHDQLIYMLPVSFGIFIISILVAFSTRVRTQTAKFALTVLALLHLIYAVVVALALKYTPWLEGKVGAVGPWLNRIDPQYFAKKERKIKERIREWGTQGSNQDEITNSTFRHRRASNSV